MMPENKYRTVKEIMEYFGCSGKEDDPEYLKDVLIRVDALYRAYKRHEEQHESSNRKGSE